MRPLNLSSLDYMHVSLLVLICLENYFTLCWLRGRDTHSLWLFNMKKVTAYCVHCKIQGHTIHQCNKFNSANTKKGQDKPKSHNQATYSANPHIAEPSSHKLDQLNHSFKEMLVPETNGVEKKCMTQAEKWKETLVESTMHQENQWEEESYINVSQSTLVTHGRSEDHVVIAHNSFALLNLTNADTGEALMEDFDNQVSEKVSMFIVLVSEPIDPVEHDCSAADTRSEAPLSLEKKALKISKTCHG